MQRKTFLALLLYAGSTIAAQAGDIEWFNAKKPVSYHISCKTSPVVSVAIDMFTQDIKTVTDKTPVSASTEKATIQITQLDMASASVKNTLRRLNVPVDTLAAKKDGFYLAAAEDGKIIIAGNNGRGTAYGILELSRMAGVSPWFIHIGQPKQLSNLGNKHWHSSPIPNTIAQSQAKHTPS